MIKDNRLSKKFHFTVVGDTQSAVDEAVVEELKRFLGVTTQEEVFDLIVRIEIDTDAEEIEERSGADLVVAVHRTYRASVYVRLK